MVVERGSNASFRNSTSTSYALYGTVAAAASMPIENSPAPLTVRAASTPAVDGSASITIAFGGPGVDVGVGDTVAVAELGTGVKGVNPVFEHVIVASVTLVPMFAELLAIVVVPKIASSVIGTR